MDNSFKVVTFYILFPLPAGLLPSRRAVRISSTRSTQRSSSSAIFPPCPSRSISLSTRLSWARRVWSRTGKRLLVRNSKTKQIPSSNQDRRWMSMVMVPELKTLIPAYWALLDAACCCALQAHCALWLQCILLVDNGNGGTGTRKSRFSRINKGSAQF
jgi:hypothetical protein